MDKKQVLIKIKQYCFIIFAAILLAFNYVIFITSNKFAPSGINGIATMLQYKFHFSIGFFSLIVNIPLCTIAFFVLSKDFAIKTMLFSVVYSVAYLILQQCDLSSFIYQSNGTDVIIPVLAAAIISGFVYGVCFKQNGSTGGTDVIAKFIAKKWPNFNFVWIIFAINCVVAAISYFVYKETNDLGEIYYNFKPVILCIFYSFMSSSVSNKILAGSKSAIKFEVITEYGKELSDAIMSELHHGVTSSVVNGEYSDTEKYHLICIINKHQIAEFEDILKRFPNTFAYMCTVNDTFGNFKKIKK